MNFDKLGEGHDICVDARSGGIRYQSRLRKEVVEQYGTEAWEMLMACVEDNICEDGKQGEYIDWGSVQRDYDGHSIRHVSGR